MAIWNLTPQYKKSAVEKMFFYKNGMIISIEQGFRWANFTVESDERPLTDEELKNEDGYELGCIDNDECWEMSDMIDGCWIEITKENSKVTDEEFEAFEAAWEEDSFEAVESLGWSNDETEYYYFGPLELTNESTGEVFKGEPDEVPDAGPEILKQAITELVEEYKDLEEEKPIYTDWFPVDINPVRTGTYQVLHEEMQVSWPFESNVKAAEWDGTAWNDNKVVKWRGLTQDPTE